MPGHVDYAGSHGNPYLSGCDPYGMAVRAHGIYEIGRESEHTAVDIGDRGSTHFQARIWDAQHGADGHRA